MMNLGVDDALSAPFMCGTNARHQEDAGQVRVENRAPLGQREVDEVLANVHTGVVDENLNVPGAARPHSASSCLTLCSWLTSAINTLAERLRPHRPLPYPACRHLGPPTRCVRLRLPSAIAIALPSPCSHRAECGFSREFSCIIHSASLPAIVDPSTLFSTICSPRLHSELCLTCLRENSSTEPRVR